MNRKKKMKSYRIGDYARYMGVTPDFLKHYEQYGLLTPSVTDSGYRYYPFNQASRILACMDLRSYGIPLREMNDILKARSMDAYCDKLDDRIEQLRQKIAFEQAIVAAHERLRSWTDHMKDKAEDWRIVEGDPFFFLPHTNLYTFLRDERIYEILDDWIPWMPIVKSCLSIRGDALPTPTVGVEDSDSPYCWGLAVPAGFAAEHHIPINDAVSLVPARKRFEFHFSNFSPTEEGDFIPSLHRVFLERLSALNLVQTGDIYTIILHKSHGDQGALFNGFMIAPID